ncbi:MAG TPA: AtpZ/AtpI family protein, partial [Polyangiaceae bacterium]|nr:AtpZ/AtpI family protein [Polyangiaceae bacterium]
GIGSYGTVGLDFAVAVTIGLLGGWWLDKKVGWTPWLTIVGLLFGVAAGFNILFKAAKRLREQTEREERIDSRQRDGNGDSSER